MKQLAVSVGVAILIGALGTNVRSADKEPTSSGTGPESAKRSDTPVTLLEDGSNFTLDNGYVTARIDKQAGTFSLKHKDLDVISRGYWGQVGKSSVGHRRGDTRPARRRQTRTTCRYPAGRCGW